MVGYPDLLYHPSGVKQMGHDPTGLQQYPLWYANWDGAKSFSDFEPFGGWTKPAIKQYADKGDSDCNVPVDLDWY